MSKKRGSSKVFRDKKGKTPEGSEQGREMLQAFLADMVMEWNLRLFLEAENEMPFYPRSVLWVEKAVVTFYDACPGNTLPEGRKGR